MELAELVRLYAEADASCRYQRVALALENGIRQGLAQPGTALPTQRALAEALGLTVGTVTHGYAEASKSGLISSVVGRGTFVSSSRPDVDVLPPPSPLDEAAAEKRGEASWSRSSSGNETAFRNLGFIAPFEWLNPSLPDALERLQKRLDFRFLSQLQSYHRPAGMERHREAGAVWARRYGIPVSPDSLLICAGSQHALMTLLTSLCSPGDRIAAEPLSYPLLRQLAWRLRLNLASIRSDACGMLPDALDSACRSGGVRAVYLMPSCRNPTLTRMPEKRRRDLVEVCRRHNVLIIEDDVYALAVEAGTPAPTFFSLAPERTCAIAATSEILGGGLRVAYLCPPDHFLEELEHTISYTISMVPPLMAELASQWILDGTADSVLKAKREEAAVRNAMVRSVFDGWPVVSRTTGFFCWLPLPEAWTGIRFADAAKSAGVLVAEGEHFLAGHALQEYGVRIALGGLDRRDDLDEALRILAGLLEG